MRPARYHNSLTVISGIKHVTIFDPSPIRRNSGATAIFAMLRHLRSVRQRKITKPCRPPVSASRRIDKRQPDLLLQFLVLMQSSLKALLDKKLIDTQDFTSEKEKLRERFDRQVY